MNDQTLRRSNVRVLGDPDAARTLVFAHGFGSNQASWRFVVDALARDHRVVLLDLIGHGGSDPGAFSRVRHGALDGFADDLIEVADALALRGAVAVAHSASGVIAALAATKRPELFERIVMISTSPRYVDEPGYVGGFDQAGVDAVLRAMAADFDGWLRGLAPNAMSAPDQPLLATEFAQSIAAMNPATALVVMRSILTMDHRRTLAQLAAPVLLLQPSDDVFVPAEVGAYLARTMRQCTLRTIDAPGHFPHMTTPNVVIDAIRDFLAR